LTLQRSRPFWNRDFPVHPCSPLPLTGPVWVDIVRHLRRSLDCGRQMGRWHGCDGSTGFGFLARFAAPALCPPAAIPIWISSIHPGNTRQTPPRTPPPQNPAADNPAPKPSVVKRTTRRSTLPCPNFRMVRLRKGPAYWSIRHPLPRHRLAIFSKPPAALPASRRRTSNRLTPSNLRWARPPPAVPRLPPR